MCVTDSRVHTAKQCCLLAMEVWTTTRTTTRARTVVVKEWESKSKARKECLIYILQQEYNRRVPMAYHNISSHPQPPLPHTSIHTNSNTEISRSHGYCHGRWRNGSVSFVVVVFAGEVGGRDCTMIQKGSESAIGRQRKSQK